MPIPSSILTATPGDFDLEVTAGVWPADLHGEMVISSPLPDKALAHGFFGFGMMNRLSLELGKHGAGADKVAWRTKVIDSPSRRLFEKRPDIFTTSATGYETPLGPPNMANTAPLPWGDRLLATWDVGRPSELDPVNLNWLGDAGSIDAWGGQSLEMGSVFPFLFTSAHPLVDPDRDCLWTVKLIPDLANSFAQAPTIVRWDGDGAEAKFWPVEGAHVAGSMHQIGQTQHWLLLSDSGNFKADIEAMLGGPKSVSIDDEISMYLVRKEDVDNTPSGQPVTAVPFRMGPPPGHFYGVWDDTGGIRVIFEHMDMLDLGFPLNANDLDRNGNPIDPALAGFYSMGLTPSTLSEATLDPTSKKLTDRVTVNDADWSWSLQLSGIDWSTEGMSNPTLHHVAYHGCRPGAISRRAIEFYADRVDESAIPTDDIGGALVSFERGSLDERGRWEYPDTSDFISSPTFAPRGAPTGTRYSGEDPGGHNGYVVLPVQNDRGFRVEVFDAARVSDGPVAVASAPAGRCVPALLHSAWMPRVVSAPDAERMSFASELDDDVLATFDPDIAAVAREIAAELDG